MLRTLCFLLVIGPASGQIVRPIITDMAHACSTTGKYLSRACSVFNIIGRRAGFTSTSVLNDVKEFANSTAAIPVITSNNLVESAAITLNGTAAVAAGFTANEILWMETTAVGSEAVAVGNIRLRVVTGSIEIEQLEGRLTAKPGDWIIRGVKGEFYPCKPDIFAATYETVQT